MILLGCGLASALSGLAVATAPAPATAGPDPVAADPAGWVADAALPPGLASLLSTAAPADPSSRADGTGDVDETGDAHETGDAVLASIETASTETASESAPLPDSPAPAPAFRTVWMEVTAYCACPRCCGPNAQGITASGRPVTHNNGRFVAADTRLLPFHTRLSIPGYHGGQPVPVLDRGGAIKGNKLDVYFDSHETARQWGRRWLPVRVYE